jgi:hypothetical protein
MSDQDKENLELAVRQFGKQDRSYRFFFSASGMVITVAVFGGELIAQVFGNGEIKKY